jgi:succinate-semialdehyde dehydrogenase/glutarate-semialdehyde dehydrogenase
MTASLLAYLTNPTLLKTDCLVGGEWVSARSGGRFAVVNPAMGQELATVPKMGYEETQSAIEAADAAFVIWRKKLASERAKCLLRLAAILRENQQDLATIMCLEMGKPIAQARGEVEYSAGFLDWYAFEAQSHFGETIPPTQAGRRETTWKEPIGVVAAITPWNFPLAMAARKIAPALAAGCTVVLKPAEAAPLSALAFAGCAQEAGIPAGVLNVVTGKASEIGRALTESNRVRKLSFTGSTKTGKMLYANSAATMKKLSLELGGNAPFIVFDDADLDAALKGLELSKFRNAGQTCVCANRIFLQKGIYETFKAKLKARVEQMVVGNPIEEKTDIGCLVNHHAFENVQHLVQTSVAAGAMIVTGGDIPAGFQSPYFAPTILEGVTAEMAICQEEIFGPVAVLMAFETEEDVVKMANDTDYGLAAYFYTSDYQRAFRVSERLEYGMVGVNTGHVSSVAAPFGGYKHSGLGREASRYGLEEFLETKYVAFSGL